MSDVPTNAFDGDDPRTVAMEQRMREQGVATHEKVQVDYFGFDETHRCYLPDGVSYVDHKTLNEGARRKYLNSVNRDVKFQKATGDAIMRIASGDEKVSILKSCITGWNLIQNGNALPFNAGNLDKVLDKFPPKIIDIIHKDVQKYNDWLSGDATVEDIEREIKELEELLAKKKDEEAGKAAS